MKRLLALAALIFSLHAHASPQLESLLAPVALQPDNVLWDVLEASKTPDDVMDAAAGRGARSPAVEALLPYPELLGQMAASPQWLFDLGNAYISQPAEVLATVQVLRQRAQANGYPVNASYVTHYYPTVVYGPAWRPVHYVHHWRPWTPRVVVVHRPAVVHHHRPAVVHRHRHGVVQHHYPHRNGPPSPAVQMQRQQALQYRQHHQQYQPQYRRVPESRREPIVRSHDGRRHHR